MLFRSTSESLYSLKRHPVDVSPLHWDAFFDKKDILEIEDDSFCVYSKGDSGPVFYLLHGGGYSGLTWACFAVSVFFFFFL